MITVTVRFAPAVQRWLAERQHYGFVAQQGDIYSYAVHDVRELRGWLLSWGADAEVLTPEHVRAQIRHEAKKLAEMLT